jgi:prolyl oligopeptidase
MGFASLVQARKGQLMSEWKLKKAMRWSVGVALAIGFLLPLRSAVAGGDPPFVYPKAKKVEQVDDYHGTKVADPYRGLEDPDSTDTQTWVEAENKVTFPFLESIPQRKAIQNRLTAMWNYERYGVPFKRGGRYFFTKNDGLQNQSPLYTTKSMSEEPKLLLDTNKLSADGTVSLKGYDITEDAKYMAYGLSASGSDWEEWRVRDIETGKDRDDLIKWVKFSGASWTHDGTGFFYGRFDEPKETSESGKLKALNYYHKLCYHKLGTPQSADPIVYERKDEKEWEFSGNVTDDGRYLIITVSHGTERKNLIFYKDLQKADAQVVELVKVWEAQYGFIDNDGPLFWFQTDLDAPRNRVVAVDITKPEKANWKEIIPQAEDTLQSVSAVGNKFIATYLKDVLGRVKVFELGGKFTRDVSLPTVGTVAGFGGRRKDAETYYLFTSFVYPTTIFRYDVAGGESTVLRKPKVDINPDLYETKQVFYKSKDGTRIPMFITSAKGLKLDGNNPTYLYGYGGFDISITPRFSVSNAVWLEMGGLYAVANIRGGGEYGKDWHEAGKKLKKQNCFDDFIAAGEWLIANKYTSTPKLAIGGDSNGGLLVGACITQRPDLYGAALPAVAVMDMLRFDKFTIGWGWTSDYGSSSNPEEFKALYAYSPLHNLKAGTSYPATLVTTADHDDRVWPGHSLKFAATLQEMNSGPNPVMVRIETKAGHGAGKPTSKQIEEAADRWAFLVKALNMSVDDKLKG